MTISLKIDDQTVTELWHEARGCLVSQAAASYLCQWGEGQSIEALMETTNEGFLAPLGPLTPMRRQCALLSLRCLKIALEPLKNREFQERSEK